MLHAERLTQILTDEAICELLLEQAMRHPEREDVLERYLERASLAAASSMTRSSTRVIDCSQNSMHPMRKMPKRLADPNILRPYRLVSLIQRARKHTLVPKAVEP